MRRAGSQRSILSAREHSVNWEESESDSTISSFEDDDDDVSELLVDGTEQSFSRPLHPLLLSALRVPRCEEARALLSVGWYEEALAVSYEAKDTIVSAAALVLTGKARSALQALEAHIVTTAVVLYDVGYRTSGQISPRTGAVQRHYQTVLQNWLDFRAAGKEHISLVALTRASERAHRLVLLWQMELLDWTLWRRWYILALLLVAPDDSVVDDQSDPEQPLRIATTAYNVPDVSWIRFFFGLEGELPKDVRRRSYNTAYGDAPATARPTPNGDSAAPTPVTSKSSEQILAELLAQCDEDEVAVITAIAAMHTHRYRTGMIFASRFLDKSGSGVADELGAELSGGQPAPLGVALSGALAHVLRPEDVVLAHFIRARCALAVGERTQAVVDMTALMRCTSLTVRAVGCALALYGMPLPDAEEVVLAYDLPHTLRLYTYTLAEYIHALTLLQLGQLEQAMVIAQSAYPRTPSETLAGEFLLIIVRCATAMEDSTTILSLPLTADCCIHLAVAPAFFGGLEPAGIRLHVNSSTYRQLYPTQMALQASLRQVLPFHMNRATYFSSQERYKEAWDDTCCAVAAADELVGSAEFAFSDCFPLQVYVAACQVAAYLLPQLLGEQVDMVMRCANEPENTELALETEAIMMANDHFAGVVMRMAAEWTTRARRFYPNSSLVESMRVLWAATINEPRALTRAALLARRFPRTILAQTTFTIALFFAHRIPEAIDSAQKNLQEFPHDGYTLLVQQSLKEKNTVYVFNYRSLLPLRYSPANKRRLYTKRMIFAMILLAAHVLFTFLMLVVNMPDRIPLSDALRTLALRLQLPSAVPLMFCAVFLAQSLVAAFTPVNLIHTLLSDLQFTNTWLTRFLFGMRGIVYANVINCIQISAAGNNFLITDGFFTFVFYFVLTLLSAPFTTRMWFLPSVDEPKVGVLSWLTLMSVDAVFALFTFIPLAILAVLEPFAFILFNFFIPAQRPSGEDVSSSIRRRLLYHKHHRYEMPSRFRPGSGSRYLYIRLMAALFSRTHPPLDTLMLNDAQREEENYRAFPLVDPQLTDYVEGHPLRTELELEDIFGGGYQRGGLHVDEAESPESSSSGNSDHASDDDASSFSVDAVELDSLELSSSDEDHSHVMNPMAEVQKAMERDAERQNELVRRTASFVLATNPNADGRQTRGQRRTIVTLGSQEQPPSPSRRGSIFVSTPIRRGGDRRGIVHRGAELELDAHSTAATTRSRPFSRRDNAQRRRDLSVNAQQHSMRDTLRDNPLNGRRKRQS